MISRLTKLGYNFEEGLEYNGIKISEVYSFGDWGLIVDKDEIFSIDYEYKWYCQTQNELMKKYKVLYRILEKDIDDLDILLKEDEAAYAYESGRTFDRSINSIDPSPLEAIFENCFELAYEREGLEYLIREHPIIASSGKTAYVDYALFSNGGNWIAFEENGVTYHHPGLIGEESYRVILDKQNSVVKQNGKVYRWDTENLGNKDRVADEIKEFVGDIAKYKKQNKIKSTRGFTLYEHQVDYIKSLREQRIEGKKTALVVLPTGTGKTKICIEDLDSFKASYDLDKGLVLAPSVEILKQWEQELGIYRSKFDIWTYAKVARHYKRLSSTEYDYIVFDEAHHAVAPVMSRVISHFSPKFLLGLTATHQRLDEKKLEKVFDDFEVGLDLRTAIEKGILAPIRAYRLMSNIDLSEVRFNDKDYYNSQLERAIRVESRNELIADVLHEYFYCKLKGKQGIVFCVSVAHAKEMSKLLRIKGFTAESVDGQDRERERKVQDYIDGKIQFLCTCSLLTEGWDAPNTSVIVMARPTMSKVLYLQQLGRGTRRAPGKEALYVIDVVDSYGSFGSISNRALSLHSIFGEIRYKPFGDLVGNSKNNDELIIIGNTSEQAIKLDPIDIFSFQQLIENHLSVEELARELFVSTGTVNSWILKGDIKPDITVPMGRGRLMYFDKGQVDGIRVAKSLKVHNESTIVEDFWEFIDQRDYTFSYKMYFLLAFFDVVDNTGDASIEAITENYIGYYKKRLEKGEVIEKDSSPYSSREFLDDYDSMQKNMLRNPFEKFERKRFMYYSKEISKISLHHSIWKAIKDRNGEKVIRAQMEEDLSGYYN